MTEYVIGGGLSGLIYATLNPGSIIVSPELGGQFSGLPLGPRFVHATDWTKKFFDQLGLPNKLRTVNVGFYYSGSIKKNYTLKHKRLYMQKSRGMSCSIRSSMSGGKTSYEVHDISPAELVHSLTLALGEKTYYCGTVTNIASQSRLLRFKDDSGGTVDLRYDKLVSTIPAPVFWRLAGYKSNAAKFNGQSVVYLYTNADTSDMEYDYVYNCEEHDVCYRTTKVGDGMLCYEFLAEKLKDFVSIREKIVDNIVDIRFVKNSQLLPSAFKNKPPRHTTFLGRYAEWDHGVRIHNVIERCMKEKVSSK